METGRENDISRNALGSSDLQKRVVDRLNCDNVAAEYKMALFSSALLSYRKDSCVRPFPAFLKESSIGGVIENRNLDKLVRCLPL